MSNIVTDQIVGSSHVAGTYVDLGDGGFGLQVVQSAGGVVAATGAAALTASTDYLLTFAEQVSKILIQNKSAAAVLIEFDAVANVGSLSLPASMATPIELIVPCTILHLFSIGTPNVNGTAALNVVVKGWR